MFAKRACHFGVADMSLMTLMLQFHDDP